MGLVGWSLYISWSSVCFRFALGGIGRSWGNSYPWIVESGVSVVVHDGGSVSTKVSGLGIGSGFGVGGKYNEFWILLCDL